MATMLTPSSHHATPLSASRMGLVPPAMQNPNQAGASAAPALPKAVLQALPPHRRAQVILQDMTGLTFRLLELAGKSWQGGYHKNLIPPFLNGVPVPAEGLAATTTKEVMALLRSQQALLTEAVSEISDLQSVEHDRKQIAESIAAKDVSMRAFAKRVRDAEQVLEYTLEEYDQYRSHSKRQHVSTETSNGTTMDVGLGTVNVDELISYAHKISYTTFELGQPGSGALPPAPQEPQMRASQLYQYSDMELGTPEDAGVTKMEVVVPQVQAPVAAAAASAAAAAAAAALPKGVPAPPPMPMGWKPGDKIAMGGDKAGPTVVPYVSLDLNPELEEDYGSDEYDGEEDEQSSGETD